MSEVDKSALPEAAPPPPKKKNHGWIYFFVFIFAASIGVTVFMIGFNLWMQLKPDQLEDARKLWKETNIQNYNMVYTKQLNNDPRVFTFAVKVRKGEVTEVRMNGDLLKPEKDGDRDPNLYHSMDRLFADMDRFMTIDKKPGAPKVYVIASFDPRTGAVQSYTRRVMGTSDRVQIKVILEALEK